MFVSAHLRLSGDKAEVECKLGKKEILTPVKWTEFNPALLMTNT